MKTFKVKFQALMILSSAVFLNACSPKAPSQQAPPEEFKFSTLESAQINSLMDPQVNVLFVVDNSGSMKPFQKKMSDNIEKFAEIFFKNKRIDYRVGVVPVYDSTYLNDTTVYPRNGLRKMNALGELVSLKGLPAKENPPWSTVYITRETPNPVEVLKRTVSIGVQWGPEAEEAYTPVLAIAQGNVSKEKNQDFYLPDAYLAVIFLTDADDVSPGLSAEDFYNRLVELKKGDRSKILIAAALRDVRAPATPECPALEKGPVQSFPALMAASGGIWADLCSNDFGKKLAQFGEQLVQRVGGQRIALNFTPDIESLKVTYGRRDQPENERQVIPAGYQGYTYNPRTNEIVISPYLNVERTAQSSVWVTAKPASLGNYRNGRLTTVQ